MNYLLNNMLAANNTLCLHVNEDTGSVRLSDTKSCTFETKPHFAYENVMTIFNYNTYQPGYRVNNNHTDIFR